MPNIAPAKVATSPNPTRIDSCISPCGAMSAPTYSSANPPTDSIAAVTNCSIRSFILPPFYPPHFPSDLEGMGTGLPLITRMRCIVLLAEDLPEVLLHRLAATRLIALRSEVDLVGRDLRQIFTTCSHSLCYCGKTLACVQLVTRRQRASLHFLPHVQTVATVVGRSRSTVRT